MTDVLCRNPQHDHHLVHGASCFPIVDPDRPLPDRVVGTVVVAVLTLGLSLAVVAERALRARLERARLRSALRAWSRDR